jgi:hypothetical protein
MKILYGKSKKAIAMTIPVEDTNTTWKTGVLDDIAPFEEEDNEKISLEEFLGI